MKVCVEESGNSGTALYDLHQPILAYAGVWLSDVDVARMEDHLSTLRARHKLQGSGEPKGRVLLKSAGGRSAIRDVLDTLAKHSVPLSLVAVHKPFLAAAVLVEDCTDYVYNRHLTEQWTWDTRPWPLVTGRPSALRHHWSSAMGSGQRYRGSRLDGPSPEVGEEIRA